MAQYNTEIQNEIFTIYRKLKRGPTQEVYYPTTESLNAEDRVFKFNRFRNLEKSKYIFLNEKNFLRESNNIYNFFEEKQDRFWLNIHDPNEMDFNFLRENFNINPLTIHDLRSGESGEKIETYRDYNFIILKLYENRESNIDINFNILIFKNFIITTHDKNWTSITDIVNFIFLMNSFMEFQPDWILYSVLIELLQDFNYFLDHWRNEVYVLSSFKSLNFENYTPILRKNIDSVVVLYLLQRFIKPKIELLHVFRTKNIISKSIRNEIQFIFLEFQKQREDMKELSKLLERGQDLMLTLVNTNISKEGNEMNKVMKRFTFVTFLFLPMQAVSGLMGMNCLVPFQKGFFSDENSLIPFYLITLLTFFISFIYLFYVEKWRPLPLR